MVKDKEGKEGGGELESFLFGPRSQGGGRVMEGADFPSRLCKSRKGPPRRARRSPTPASREAAGRPPGPACLVYLILTGSERERDS